VLLAAVLAAVAFTGVASGGHARKLDSVWAGTWQSTRGEMIIRSYNDFVDFGEYGDNMIGRLCGTHQSNSDDPLAVVLSGWWYEGGPTFTVDPDGIDCGPLKGTPNGRFFFKASADGKTLTGKFETKGDGLPIGNTDKWPAWNATRAGSSGGSSGKTVSKLATGRAPFGTPVSGLVAVGGVIDMPSPPLPPSTVEVDASAELTEAEIDKLVESMKLALAAYNRRKALEALSYWCLVFVPQGSSTEIGLNNFAAIPNACDKFAALQIKKSGGKYRYLSALKAGCAVAFVPFWKPGSRVTVKQHNAALAAARSEVQASCTGTHSGRLAFKIVARGSTTLNQVLGKSVSAGIGTAGPAGKAQLKVTWAPPRTRVSPGSTGKAKPGHYTGQTNAAGTIAFDVTADSAGVTNLKFVAQVDCTDTTSWNWTITSSSTNPISASRTFSRTYSGGLKISSSTISNINIAYTLSGTLTSAGSASGKFQVSHMTWDQSGKHYDCTSALTSWTAKLGS
jgi:hypothetical protein